MNSLRVTVVLLSTVLAGTTALAGQTGPISPTLRTASEGNAASNIPFGSVSPRRYLQIHSDLPQSAIAIQGLSWRQTAGTGTATGTRTLDMALSLVRSLRADIVRFNFAANYLAPPTEVVARRNVNFGPQGAASSPGPSPFQGMSLTFDRPFAWSGQGSLAWEATIFGGTSAGAFAAADAEDYPRNAATNVASGNGCIATGNNDPMRLDVTSFALGLGTFYATSVRAAPADAPLFLTLGAFDPDVPVRGLCTNVRTDLAVTVPLGAADGAGTLQPIGSQVLFVQRDLSGATLHAQAFALDVRSSNAIPLVGSNGVATTFAPPHPTFPDVSRIYTDGEPVTSSSAPLRADAVGFGLVTRFDT